MFILYATGQAAVWQNKRTGLFTFMGEHNGRPVYQNNATKEYLYYTFTGAEWLVGPDFRKPHAGNGFASCPRASFFRNLHEGIWPAELDIHIGSNAVKLRT